MGCCRQETGSIVDRRNLARLWGVIPFSALSSGFLRVARDPTTMLFIGAGTSTGRRLPAHVVSVDGVSRGMILTSGNGGAI
jgi:hypothetical protein